MVEVSLHLPPTENVQLTEKAKKAVFKHAHSSAKPYKLNVCVQDGDEPLTTFIKRFEEVWESAMGCDINDSSVMSFSRLLGNEHPEISYRHGV